MYAAPPPGHAGQVVQWVNTDTDDHTVVSDDAFNTAGHRGLDHLLPGTESNGGRPGTFFVRFTQPGTFGYVCLVHPAMVGTVTVKGADEEIDSAQARVETAQLDLGYCDIRAPIAGLIGAKQVSIGELVGKGQPTLLATMSTLDPIWFYCSISEMAYLKAESEVRRTGKKIADLPVILLLADGSMHPEKGKFVFIDRAVDVKTGTLRIRAEFPNSTKVLRPGMFARILRIKSTIYRRDVSRRMRSNMFS